MKQEASKIQIHTVQREGGSVPSPIANRSRYLEAVYGLLAIINKVTLAAFVPDTKLVEQLYRLVETKPFRR